MSMLVFLNVLFILALWGAGEFRPAVTFQPQAAAKAVLAMPWLLSVNWNGDEEDRKSGGK